VYCALRLSCLQYGELKGACKEAEVTYFEELSEDLLGRGKEKHANPQCYVVLQGAESLRLHQWFPNFFGPPPPWFYIQTHKKRKCAFLSTFILYLKYRLN
jgi:hypothetical protein